MPERPLLSPAFLGRLERLQLATTRPLAGRFSADHRSPRRGTSLDFADYREYQPGDDYRRIDYQLLGRLDVLLLKLFEAEDDLDVRIVIDRSTSMRFGNKMRVAAEAAAALGFVSLVRRDNVTVFPFPQTAPPQRFVGRGSAPRLFELLQALHPDGPSPAAAAARDVIARGGPGGLTILVSDLLTPDWQTALSRLPARGGEVVVLHVTSPDDTGPDLAGDVDVVDSETGERIAVTLVPEVRERLRRSVEAWRESVAAAARRSGARYVHVPTDGDIESTLLTTWRTAGVLR